MTEPLSPRRPLTILKRENYGTRSDPCWVVEARLPSGQVMAVHDPALPEFENCGQPGLCADVRELYIAQDFEVTGV